MKWANKNVRILIGSFFGSFFAVVLFLKKNKENHLEISWCHYFTPVYHRSWRYDLKFLRYRVGLTEIGNNRSFFALLPHYWPQKLKPGKNIKKPWRYYPFTRKWKVNEDQRCMVREIKGRSDRVLLFWAIFYPPDNPKNQNFEKTTQIPQDIILHLCTTNDNYMMYGSWYRAQ